MKKFTKAMIKIFGSEYLRAPIDEDAKRLMVESEERGSLGMLGSIDSMHWTWKNYHVAWKR